MNLKEVVKNKLDLTDEIRERLENEFSKSEIGKVFKEAADHGFINDISEYGIWDKHLIIDGVRIIFYFDRNGMLSDCIYKPAIRFPDFRDSVGHRDRGYHYHNGKYIPYNEWYSSNRMAEKEKNELEEKEKHRIKKIEKEKIKKELEEWERKHPILVFIQDNDQTIFGLIFSFLSVSFIYCFCQFIGWLDRLKII